MNTDNNSKRKALFLDLDGTLLNDQKEITEGNRKAIGKALAAGHSIIICTGRPLISAVMQAEKLGLTTPGCYVIAFNGGILYDTAKRESIFSASIPCELVRKVFHEANLRGLHIQTYSDTKVLVEPNCEDDDVKTYCRLSNMKYEVISDINTLTVPPAKMLLIDYKDQRPLESFCEWVKSSFHNDLDSFFSCDYYVEIVPKGLNKGTALLQMANLLHIPVENTIAAGDAANDFPMLQTAGTGVCMANGTDELKMVADYITIADNNHDGIAEIIKKFIL